MSQPPQQMIQYLRDERKNMELVNSNLLRQLEGKEQEVVSAADCQIALRKMLEDIRQESTQKDTSIEKASICIAKLTDHNEKVMKELRNQEEATDNLRSDNRQLERENTELKLLQHQMATKQITIERLREEVAKLQNENLEMATIATEEKDARVAESKVINEEKQRFNEITRAFEEKLNEIQENNRLRDSLLEQEAARAQDLMIQLQEAKDRAALLEKELQLRDQEIDEKLDKIQRENANSLRNIQTATEIENPIYGGGYAPTYHPRAQSAKLPRDKSPENALPISHASGAGKRKKSTGRRGVQIYSPKTKAASVAKNVNIKSSSSPRRGGLTRRESTDLQTQFKEGETMREKNYNGMEHFLRRQLDEAFEREAELKRMIEEVLKANGEFVQGRLGKLKEIDMLSRAEIERWMMRNEELEMRLYEGSLRIAELKNLNKHAVNGMKASASQWNEEREVHRQNKAELESAVNFLLLELDQLFNSEFPEVMDRSWDALDNLKARLLAMREMLNKREDYFKEEGKARDQERERMEGILRRREQDLADLRAEHDQAIGVIDDAVNAAVSSRELPRGIHQAGERLGRRISGILGNLDTLQRHSAALSQEKRDLQRALEQERVNAEREVRRLISELENRDESLHSLQRQYDDISQSFKELQRKMEDSVRKWEERLREMENQLRRSEHENDKLRVQLKDEEAMARAREDQLRDELRSMQDSMETKEFQLQQEKLDNKGLLQRLEKAQKRHKDDEYNFKREKVKLLERITDLESKLAHLDGTVPTSQVNSGRMHRNAPLRISPQSHANYQAGASSVATLRSPSSPIPKMRLEGTGRNLSLSELRQENQNLLAQLEKEKASKKNLERILHKSEANFNDLHQTLKDASPDRFSHSPVLSEAKTPMTPSYKRGGRWLSVPPRQLSTYHEPISQPKEEIEALKSDLRSKETELNTLRALYQEVKSQNTMFKRELDKAGATARYKKSRGGRVSRAKAQDTDDFTRDPNASLYPSRDKDPKNQKESSNDSLLYHVLRAPVNEDSLHFLKNIAETRSHSSTSLSSQTEDALRRVDRDLLEQFFSAVQHKSLLSEINDSFTVILQKAATMAQISDIKNLQQEVLRKGAANSRDLAHLLIFSRKALQRAIMESRGNAGLEDLRNLQATIARGADTLKAGASVGDNEILGVRFAGLLGLIEESLREGRGRSMERIFQLRVEELSEMLAQRSGPGLLQKKDMFIKQIYHHLSDIYEEVTKNLSEVGGKSELRKNPNFYEIMSDPKIIEASLMQNLEEIRTKFLQSVEEEVQNFLAQEQRESSGFARKQNRLELESSLKSEMIHKFQTEVHNIHNALLLSDIQLISEYQRGGEIETLLYEINSQIARILERCVHVTDDPLPKGEKLVEQRETRLLEILRQEVYETVIDAGHSRRGFNMMYHLLQKIKEYVD